MYYQKGAFIRTCCYSIVLWLFLPATSLSQQTNQVITGVAREDLFSDMVDQEGMFFLPPPLPDKGQSTAITIYNKQFQAAKTAKEFDKAAQATVNAAWVNILDGDYESALSHLQQAFDVLQDNQISKAHVKLLAGFVQYKTLNYTQAVAEFEQARTLFKSTGNPVEQAFADAYTGQCYLAAKDVMRAKSYFKSALKIFSENQIKSIEARISVQLAETAIRENQPDEAKRLLNAALTIFKNENNPNGQALVHRNFGILKFKSGAYHEAVSEFRASLGLSPQLSVSKLLKDTYLKLFMISSISGDHEKSNDLNIIYVQLRDSIDDVERSRILNSQLTRRDLMEKEAITAMLRKEGDIDFENLTTEELEKNRSLLEEEIDRLEKEKIIEDLNIAKRLSDQANLEREEKIRQLTQQKYQQELLLSQKELEVSEGNAVRNILLTASVFLVIIGFLLFTRYRNQKRSHQQLDKAYQELSETHHKLVAAQEQLVHAQKMASLGQLTAGIAHEIQNPLNFVNNFAELSVELLEELKTAGDERDEIIGSLIANLQKINTHGKRADKIVKGMLIHSRTGQVDKNPADLNKMIDELLELSYHGNRSRDKTFTAEIIKHFDQNLPEVNMVMQDISRVLINLFNNAFFAVGERVKMNEPGYTARVGVSTKQEGSRVIIKIRDNGTGIPANIRDKIFDPFFTTKPSGEGTGLGLSLSYDIVTKGHHGTINVNSEKNNFTEFTITLPIK